MRALYVSVAALLLVSCGVLVAPPFPAAPDRPGPPSAPVAGSFKRELAPPAAPHVESLPNGGRLTQRTVRVEWAPDGHPDAIAGYGYDVSRSEDAALPDAPNTTETAAVVAVPEDGDWFFHLRALDNWGNWSDPTTARLSVDSVPLEIGGVRLRTVSSNPAYTTLPITFTLSKAADVQLDVLPAAGDESLRSYAVSAAAGEVSVDWDGRDAAGAIVPAGAYRYRLAAADTIGNRTEVLRPGLRITHKRITISLAQQRLWAYEGDRLVLTTLITSGGPQTPTVAGTFEVMTRQSPFTFHSPWPRGHPFWYPDSTASFAMLFAEGGYFLHDAPWRGNFGPGSNTQLGTPGGDVTGTHGCVNIPYGAAAQLFRWAELGTPVVVGW